MNRQVIKCTIYGTVTLLTATVIILTNRVNARADDGMFTGLAGFIEQTQTFIDSLEEHSDEIGDTENITFPLYIEDGYGRNFEFDDADAQIIIQRIESENDSDLPQVDIILLDEYNVNNRVKVRCYTNPSITFSPSADAFLTDTQASITYQNGTSWHGYYYAYYYPETDTIDYIGYATGDTSTGNKTWFETDENGNIQFKKDTNLYAYPLWIKEDNQYFTMQAPTSGGSIKDSYISQFDNLGNLPQVDDTDPTDTSSLPLWLSKILKGIKQNGQNLQAGTMLIANTMKQEIQDLKNGNLTIGGLLHKRLLEIIAEFGILTTKLDTITEYQRQMAEASDPDNIKTEWVDGYENSDAKNIVTAGNNLKATLSTIGDTNTGAVTFGSWRLQYISGDLCLIGNYSLPEIFGGGTHQQILSFAWWQECKTWVLWAVKAFLYVGFAWYLLHQVPAMIQGAGTVFKNSTKGE